MLQFFHAVGCTSHKYTFDGNKTKKSGKVHVNELSLELMFIEKQARTSTTPC